MAFPLPGTVGQILCCPMSLPCCSFIQQLDSSNISVSWPQELFEVGACLWEILWTWTFCHQQLQCAQFSFPECSPILCIALYFLCEIFFRSLWLPLAGGALLSFHFFGRCSNPHGIGTEIAKSQPWLVHWMAEILTSSCHQDTDDHSVIWELP